MKDWRNWEINDQVSIHTASRDSIATDAAYLRHIAITEKEVIAVSQFLLAQLHPLLEQETVLVRRRIQRALKKLYWRFRAPASDL